MGELLSCVRPGDFAEAECEQWERLVDAVLEVLWYILRKSGIWKLVIKVQSECIFGHLHSLLSGAVLVLNH